MAVLVYVGSCDRFYHACWDRDAGDGRVDDSAGGVTDCRIVFGGGGAIAAGRAKSEEEKAHKATSPLEDGLPVSCFGQQAEMLEVGSCDDDFCIVFI